MKLIVKMVENVSDSVHFYTFSQYIYEERECTDISQTMSDKNENEDSRIQREMIK